MRTVCHTPLTRRKHFRGAVNGAGTVLIVLDHPFVAVHVSVLCKRQMVRQSSRGYQLLLHITSFRREVRSGGGVSKEGIEKENTEREGFCQKQLLKCMTLVSLGVHIEMGKLSQHVQFFRKYHNTMYIKPDQQPEYLDFISSCLFSAGFYILL